MPEFTDSASIGSKHTSSPAGEAVEPYSLWQEPVSRHALGWRDFSVWLYEVARDNETALDRWAERHNAR